METGLFPGPMGAHCALDYGRVRRTFFYVGKSGGEKVSKLMGLSEHNYNLINISRMCIPYMSTLSHIKLHLGLIYVLTTGHL
jgi:hypothetical protein